MTRSVSNGRRRLELFCRFSAIVLFGVAALTVWRHGGVQATAPRSSVFTIATPDSLRAMRDLVVRRETRESDTLRMPMRTLPSLAVRAALGTLRRSRVAGAMAWQDETGARGAAMAVEREGGPQGGRQLRVAVPDSSGMLILRDAAGVLDSSTTERSRGDRVRQWALASTGDWFQVQLSGATMNVSVVGAQTDSIHRVFVIASPGWESKFVLAALEERGWRVEGRLAVTPKAAVTIDAPSAPDRARHDVVVVLDSADVPPSLAAYVRRGGGVVFSGDGVRSPLARGMVQVAGGTMAPAVPGALLTDSPLDGLERWQFDVRDAVPLYRAAGRATVIGARVGMGRAIVSGYRNTWQWRMMGTDQGRADHADWWDALAQAALPVPVLTIGVTDPAPGDAAPFADLVAQLGAPARVRDGAGPTSRPVRVASSALTWLPSASWLPWLVALAVSALLTEWGSRRLRGEP